MASLQDFVAENVERENPTLQGLIMLGVDKDGKRIYGKTFGVDKVGPDAKPLTTDAILKVASCTKIVTAIAALQCVEQGLIDLDEPVSRILPELKDMDIISWEDEAAKKFKLTKAKTAITLRHLLTHSSGFAYEFINPLLQTWRAAQGADSVNMATDDLTKRLLVPLQFEPGQGWSYGPSIDWVGLMIKRLKKTTLQEYFAEHIFKPVGRTEPFPVFNLKRYSELFPRAMGGGIRREDGGLDVDPLELYNDSGDEYGGHGLCATSEDYLALLKDMISPNPKLLRPETYVALYTPQFIPGSDAHVYLQASSAFFDSFVRGVSLKARINHALGGIIVIDELPEYGQPAGVLTWAGLANTVWFASRDKGVAAWFGTQTSPFTDPKTMEAFNVFRKDFWAVANKS